MQHHCLKWKLYFQARAPRPRRPRPWLHDLVKLDGEYYRPLRAKWRHFRLSQSGASPLIRRQPTQTSPGVCGGEGPRRPPQPAHRETSPVGAIRRRAVSIRPLSKNATVLVRTPRPPDQSSNMSMLRAPRESLRTSVDRGVAQQRSHGHDVPPCGANGGHRGTRTAWLRSGCCEHNAARLDNSRVSHSVGMQAGAWDDVCPHEEPLEGPLGVHHVAHLQDVKAVDVQAPDVPHKIGAHGDRQPGTLGHQREAEELTLAQGRHAAQTAGLLFALKGLSELVGASRR